MKTKLQNLWYSFFIQIFFNYHTMISVGSCFLLDKLLGKENIPRNIRLRLVIFFNGNPYIIPYAISAISKEIKNKTEESRIIKFIDSVVTILGAVGDQYYWNSLKPVVLLFPMSVYLISGNNIDLTLYSSIASFLLYNIIQIKERLYGLKRGEEKGLSVIRDIIEIKSRWINLNFSKVAFFLILISLIFYMVKVYENGDIFVASLFAFCWGVISGRRGGTKKYYLFAILSYTIIEVIEL